jgi:hypothetical protein
VMMIQSTMYRWLIPSLSKKPLLTRSLVDPAVASRKPHPKVVVVPPVATFPLCRGPWSPRGSRQQDKKSQRSCRRDEKLPRPFPRLFCASTRVPVWKISQGPFPSPTVCASIDRPCFECEAPRLSRLALSNIRCA